MDMSLSRVQDLVMDKEAWPIEVHRVTKSQTQLSDWTELPKGHERYQKEALSETGLKE